MKTVLQMVVSVTVICIAGFIFAQVPTLSSRTTSSDRSAPANIRTSPAYNNDHAARSFLALSTIRQKLDSGARCLFDEARGHCINVSGQLSLPVPKTERADILRIATRFLTKHADLLAVPDVQKYFKCSAQEVGRTDAPRYVRCQEAINGTPIFGAELSVAVDPMGVVRSVDSSHIADLQNTYSTTPRLSQESAITAAMREIPNATNSESHGLFIIPQETPNIWKLAWVVAIFTTDRYYLIAIDATDGSVVFKSDQTRLEPACTPVEKDWGVEKEKLPVCQDGQTYFLYTGLNFDPASYGIYDDVDQMVKYSSWPPPPFQVESSPYVFARMREALQYLKTSYGQISYCKPNTLSCPIFIKALKSIEGNYAGLWHGKGKIDVSKPSSAEALVHELGHGMVDSYLPQKVGGYCDKNYPESAAIEEGLVEVIAELISKYLFSYEETTYSKEYAVLVKSKYCAAHWFGFNLIGGLRRMLMVGHKDALGAATGLDILYLFNSKTLGTIFIDTLRTKPNWRSNMTEFGAAMLSTCNDNIPKLVTVDHCKNIERALNMMEIYPSGFYKPELMGKQELSFPIDAKAASITPTSYFKYGKFGMHLAGTGDMLLNGVLPQYGVPELAPQYFDSDSNESLGYGSCQINGASASGYTCSLYPDIEFSPDAITIQSSGQQFHTYPLMDKIRIFLFKVTGQLPNYGYTTLGLSKEPLYDINAANNGVVISIGPDFVPDMDFVLAPQSEQPLCLPGLTEIPNSGDFVANNCPQKYHVTVYAYNWGNKVTFPIVKSTLFTAKDQAKADAYFKTLYIEGSSPGKNDPAVIATSADVALWKSGKQLTTNGKLPVSVTEGGKIKYAFTLPGEHFTVAQHDVVARPGDTYTIIIESPLPELNLINNKMTYMLPEKPTSNSNMFTRGTLLPRFQAMKMDGIVNMIKLADYLSTVPPIVKLPIPPEPIFDDGLTNPGETILAAPDPQGTYPAWALPDPQEYNQQAIDAVMEKSD